MLRELPIDEIKVRKGRARVDFGDLDELAESIKQYGVLQPIAVDQDGFLLAGERRLRASKQIGLSVIPTITIRVDGVINSKEIELFENIHRKDLKWPERANLEREIQDYKRSIDPSWSQRDQAKAVGVDVATVNRRVQLAEAMELLPDLAECETEDEAWKKYKKLEEAAALNMLKKRLPPEVLQAIEKAGEHYNVGDAFAGMAALADESFDFAEVDTPYGVDLHDRRVRNQDQDPMESYHEWTDFEAQFTRTVQEVFRLLKPHSFAVFWYGMSWHTQVMDMLRKNGFSIPDIPAVWVKGGGGQTASPDTTWGSCYEPFFLARKGQPKLAKPGRGNVFDFAALKNKVHATEKPVDLIKEILSVVCLPGSRVLCPFLGSGVTLRAAYRLGHTGLGWDMSEEHKDGFLKRIQEDQKK